MSSATYKQEMLELKIELIRRGITQTEIARGLGLAHASVNLVLNGHRKNSRVVGYIQELLKRAA